jgi:protocatechuate 3,4-dioxygenase, beta subunit
MLNVSAVYLLRQRQPDLPRPFRTPGYPIVPAFGRFLTGSTGEYYFRTIKPVPYTGRPAAHIHFKIWKDNKVQLTTECFVKGYKGNERDGIYRRATASKGGERLPVEFAPIKGSRVGELAARFDVVLGYLPTA